MHLELSAALGELEGNSAAGEAAVDLAVGIEAVVDTTTLLLVEDDLEGLGTVLLGAGALTDNLDGVDEVGEDGVVDGGQSARAGALLGLGGARVGGALGAGQDAALGHEENVAVGELLLELAGKTSLGVSSRVVLIEVVFFVGPFVLEGLVVAYRCWILWKLVRRGTGTKTMMAFLPWPTSTYIARIMSERCPVQSVVYTEIEFLLERRLALRIFISVCILPPLLMIPLHVGDFWRWWI